MRKKKLLSVTLVLAVFGLANIACAGIIGIGAFSGNDDQNNLSNIEEQIETWFSNNGYGTIDVELSIYAKVDAPATTSGGLTLTYDSAEKTGTWSTLIPIDFFTVKAGNRYYIYWVDPADTSGKWTTAGLVNGGGQQPTISHLQTYTWTNQSVPEPATIILMGGGLFALALWRKRRQSI